MDFKCTECEDVGKIYLAIVNMAINLVGCTSYVISNY